VDELDRRQRKDRICIMSESFSPSGRKGSRGAPDNSGSSPRPTKKWPRRKRGFLFRVPMIGELLLAADESEKKNAAQSGTNRLLVRVGTRGRKGGREKLLKRLGPSVQTSHLLCETRGKNASLLGRIKPRSIANRRRRGAVCRCSDGMRLDASRCRGGERLTKVHEGPISLRQNRRERRGGKTCSFSSTPEASGSSKRGSRH